MCLVGVAFMYSREREREAESGRETDDTKGVWVCGCVGVQAYTEDQHEVRIADEQV